MTTTTKLPITLLVGLGLVGALAGCSAPAAIDDNDGDTDSGSETDTDAGTDAGTDSGTDGGTDSGYVDGTYTASGDYQAPSGTETVEVTVTLADGVITEVTAVGDATDPQAQGYQGQFAAGIGAIVVGKSIDDIQVDKVGGSSLTSGGFTSAIDAIKADAAA